MNLGTGGTGLPSGDVGRRAPGTVSIRGADELAAALILYNHLAVLITGTVSASGDEVIVNGGAIAPADPAWISLALLFSRRDSHRWNWLYRIGNGIAQTEMRPRSAGNRL